MLVNFRIGGAVWGERVHYEPLTDVMNLLPLWQQEPVPLRLARPEDIGDAKGFEEKARQLSLGLEVYKAFKEQITGNHRPLQYNMEAADAVADS